jgi:hypothetical protein
VELALRQQLAVYSQKQGPGFDDSIGPSGLQSIGSGPAGGKSWSSSSLRR